MTHVRACALPQEALLRRYAQGRGYTDCYVTQVAGAFDLAAYVECFYTTRLFKLERAVLALIGRPSRDRQAKALAAGEAPRFAAWDVEQRAPDQLLMCDFLARTRSWFMVEQAHDGTQDITHLYFGTAIPPAPDRETIGYAAQALLAFHKPYAQALLRAAGRKLERIQP